MSADFAIETSTTGGVDDRWLASSHGVTTISGTADVASLATAVDARGILPGGVALGVITASGRAGLYTPGATNGTEVLAGFTREAVNTRNAANATVPSGKVPVAIVKTATIARKFLPVVAQRTSLTHTTVSTGQFVFTD